MSVCFRNHHKVERRKGGGFFALLESETTPSGGNWTARVFSLEPNMGRTERATTVYSSRDLPKIPPFSNRNGSSSLPSGTTEEQGKKPGKVTPQNGRNDNGMAYYLREVGKKLTTN